MSKDTVRADVLTEFLEVAIHSILYTRELYPRQIFDLRKKYQIPIYVSKHPKVNDYINSCLGTVRHLLQSDSVKDVSVAILRDGELQEKYVFSLRLTGTDASEDYLVSVEEIFRQYILKLTVIDSGLERLPRDCTFAIQVTTNEQCFVRLNETAEQCNFPWIEAEDLQKSNPEHKIIPVKSSNCPFFSLTVYVEK